MVCGTVQLILWIINEIIYFLPSSAINCVSQRTMGNLRCKYPMQIQLLVKIRRKPKADAVMGCNWNLQSRDSDVRAKLAAFKMELQTLSFCVRACLCVCMCVCVCKASVGHLLGRFGFQAFILPQWFPRRSGSPRGHLAKSRDTLVDSTQWVLPAAGGEGWLLPNIPQGAGWFPRQNVRSADVEKPCPNLF